MLVQWGGLSQVLRRHSCINISLKGRKDRHKINKTAVAFVR